MTITEVAIKRPLLITVIFLSLIIFGLISFNSLNYNLLPKFEANVITVLTIYRGASAEEVQNTVTKKIEDAVSALEGIDKLLSTSQEGASIIQIQLKAEANVDRAQQNAQRKIDQIRSQLPDGIDNPIINKFASDETPVLRIGVSANQSPTQVFDLITDKIKPQLANVAGVGQVNVIGGVKREIRVNVDPDKLKAYKIPLGLIVQSVETANKSFPAGKVESGDLQFPILFDANLTAVEQMNTLVLRHNPDGSKIFLTDVAELVDGAEEQTTLNRVNGNPSIGLEIYKQTDANAVDVSKNVKKRIAELEALYSGENLKFTVSTDQSNYTLATANAVTFDLVLAIFIVALVMLAFLHSVRSSFFVLVALPSSMIPTFIGMYALDFSLNLMTLMGLSLTVGILVDDSIVVLENIYRHMEMGKDRRKAAIEGRAEIGFTAMAITLVDVVVFVPMALITGLIGNILREFAMVVVFSTLLSLLVSFTLTPLLVSRFGRLVHLTDKTWWGKMNLWFEQFIFYLRDEYGKILRWSLSNKILVFVVVIVLLAGSVTLAVTGFIGQAFITQGDRGEISIKIEMAPQTSVRQTNQVVRQVENILLNKPEVINVFANVGYSAVGVFGGSTANSNLAEITVKLVDAKKRALTSEEFSTQLKKEIAQIPGVKVTVNQILITGQTADAVIQIGIKGTEMAKIRETARIVKEVTQSVPGTQDVQFSVKDPKPQIEVQLNRDRMAQLGISATDVGNALQIAFRGVDRSKFKQEGNEYDILVSLDKFNKANIDDVRKLAFVNTRGQTFELSQFATVSETMGESVMERIDRLNSMKVNSGVLGRPNGSVGRDIKNELDKREIPEGVTIEYLGDLQRQADAFKSLGFALVMGLVLVYLIMVALYESVVYPFVVLFSVPVAVIGALLALALAMEDLTIFSAVGMIMLLGLVSKNAILIVDFTNHLKEKGMPVVDALVEAGKERLRPILMTTVAMIFGMLPIALATGSGAEVKNGMAWAIIGGLSSSLILTLVVVPAVYLVVETLMNRFGWIFARRKARRRQRREGAVQG
ncbi:MAG: efflux RND transporter permease subunit [Chitinophagales bacterium]|nr:efflux RND transporter permease subunit [Chitinophagales bacterium]